MNIKFTNNRANGFRVYSKNESTFIDSTTDEYAETQSYANIEKTERFLLPLMKELSVSTALDVGCGVGSMVTALNDNGIDAYGVDLLNLGKYWARLNLDRDRFLIVDPCNLELPFHDKSFDFVFSLGAIEHVGTSNGHSDRLHNYKDIRRDWLRELFRVVKDDKYLLIGGPNRMFPIDVAHSPDTQASKMERVLSKISKCSVHFPWNDGFLWSYGEVIEFLEGLSYEIKALSIKEFLYLSRVPTF